jgi:hypothetical protein
MRDSHLIVKVSRRLFRMASLRPMEEPDIQSIIAFLLEGFLKLGVDYSPFANSVF